MTSTSEHPHAPRPPSRISDEVAYVAPMFVFLGLLAVGSTWPALYVAAYVARALVVAGLLWAFRRHYTPISWRHAGWGVLVGVLGIVQWVGMQYALQRASRGWPVHPFGPTGEPFDPTAAFRSRAAATAFIAFRWAGAVLVVPVMEELFWRDFLWRTILAPNDFKLAAVGEWAWGPFLLVSGLFAVVHGAWWLTAIVWALMVGVLLVRTKSLGACIIAHATTNLLLGAWVLWSRDWSLW